MVAEALRRNYTVVAFVHSHNPFEPHARLQVQKGDVYNGRDVAAALQGSEAVVSCLGSWGTPGKDVLTRFVTAVVLAMREHNIVRIVTLTGVGVQQRRPLWYRVSLKLLPALPTLGKVFLDADQHVQLLQASGLDWTTLCSPVMRSGDNARYVLRTRQGLALPFVTRRAVATAMLDQIGDTCYRGQAVSIHHR